jgi:hypothetical protein
MASTRGPDWSNIQEEIHCPLCGYNLHGLTDPRCPECGYRFEWPDLLDPTRRLHPYLFEHHPERNFWSFWKTAIGGLLPRRFWRTLQPVQPSRPRRLVLYWLLVLLICFVCLQVCLVWIGGTYTYWRWRNGLMYRAALLKGSQQADSPSPEYGPVGRPITDPVLLRRYVDRYCPTRLTMTFVKDFLADGGGQAWVWLQFPLLLLLWPWVSFGSLMIFRPFRQSMRKVRTRPVHILRCTIYSSGTLVWIAVLAVATTVATMWRARYGVAEVPLAIGLGLAGLMMVWMVWQLIVACRSYLRLPDAGAIVVCSQLLLVLVLRAVHALVSEGR